MTKDLFLRYEAVRQSGRFNMVMEADKAMAAMKLNPRHKSDQNLYFDIIKNYSNYSSQWL